MVKKYYYLFLTIFFFVFHTTNKTISLPTPFQLSFNRDIINNFSFKEHAIFWGLFLGPSVFKYYGETWNDFQLNKDDLSLPPKGKKNLMAAEYTDLGQIKNILKNMFQGEKKFNNFKKFFGNVFIRTAIIYFALPLLFKGTELTHKNFMNQWHKSNAKEIFLAKKKFNEIINKNDPTLSSISEQLLEQNKNKAYNKVNLYKDLLEIKNILIEHQDFLDSEEHINIIREKLKNKINKTLINNSLKNIEFILKNKDNILELSGLEGLNKPYNKNINKSTLLDKEYIEKDADLEHETGWENYKQYLSNQSPYPFSKYFNEDTDNSPWFNET